MDVPQTIAGLRPMQRHTSELSIVCDHKLLMLLEIL